MVKIPFTIRIDCLMLHHMCRTVIGDVRMIGGGAPS
jgi:hypothetical protein